jgi:hypothetical protein
LIGFCEIIGALGFTGSCIGTTISCGTVDGMVGVVTTGISGVTTVGIVMVHVVCGVVSVFGKTPVLFVVQVFITVPVFSMMIGSADGIAVLLL